MPVPQENLWRFLWPRLILLITIALAPAAVITLNTFLDLRKSSYQTMQERLVGFTNVAASQQERSIEGARQFLIALAHIPEIRSLQQETCTTTLTKILKENPLYLNIGVTDAEGNGVCSVLPFQRSISARDRPWFQRALATKGFAIGDYQIGRITGKPSVNVALPIVDENDRVHGVIVAALGLEWLNALVARASLPPHTTLTVFDRNHTIIIRQPDPERWVGLTTAHHPLSLLMQQQKQGTVRLIDLDGVLRLHAFTSLPGEVGLPGAYVRMSMAETAILSGVYTNLRGNIFLLLIGTLLTGLVAWLSCRILIGRFITEREHIDALKSDFISLASHQLRTPLTTIRWIIEVFLSGRMGSLPPKQLDLAKDAKVCADNMSAMIRTLLLISRAEVRDFTTKHTIVEISPLLQELRDEYAHVANKKHLTVTIACPEDIAMMTDREILREILENLLSNAIHYTPDSGTITLCVKGIAKNRIQFTVTDTGYGIPLSQQERVFTKFFRGANVVKRQTEGSGLGLYLVHILVGILGGTITFSSEENSGTTFSVLLPPSPPSDAEVAPHR